MTARLMTIGEAEALDKLDLDAIFREQGALAQALDMCRMSPHPEPSSIIDRDESGRYCMLYFIHNPAVKLIKIGISVNVRKRMMDLEAACGCDLKLLGYHYGGRVGEQRLHRHFTRQRRKGEWFTESDTLFEMAELHHQKGLQRILRKYRVRK